MGKECSVLRKLVEGETFEMVGDVMEDNGVCRVEMTALKDGKKGWITTKGNAGTVYAEPSAKSYSVTREVFLNKKFTSSDQPEDVVRTLETAERFQLLEGPREEQSMPEVRVKVRATNDGEVGWITKKADTVKPCTVV